MREWPQVGDDAAWPTYHGDQVGKVLAVYEDDGTRYAVVRSAIARITMAVGGFHRPWIKNDGKSWPNCGAMDIVEIVLRDGSQASFQANSRSWAHFDDPEDIIHYRVISQPDTPPPLPHQP